MGQLLKKQPGSRERRAGVLDRRFQENLRLLRKARGLKQGELAEAMGWASPNYVSQLETGIRGFSPELVEQLALFFKIDPGAFFQPTPRRAVLRSIFETLPAECLADLRGTGKCDELVEMFKTVASKELRPKPASN